MGLREQIRKANSDSEIKSLLDKGKSFEFASNITKNSWRSTARFRLAELTNPIPVQNASKPVESKKIKKNKVKK
jgi:hypothetical protein